jgi:hypothetical protein
MSLSQKQHNARTPCMSQKLRKGIKQRKLQSTLVSVLKSRKTLRIQGMIKIWPFFAKKEKKVSQIKYNSM